MRPHNLCRPNRRSNDTPTDLRRSHGTVRGPNNSMGSPQSCSVSRSSRSHTNTFHFCTGHAHCNGHRKALCCRSHHPNHPHTNMFRLHIGHVNHSQGRKVLKKGEKIVFRMFYIFFLNILLPFEQSSPLHFGSQLHDCASRSNVPCPEQSGRHCNASWSMMPQSCPFHPFLQMQAPSAQNPCPEQVGCGQSTVT